MADSKNQAITAGLWAVGTEIGSEIIKKLASRAGNAVERHLGDNSPEKGGKGKFTDEKWLDYTRRQMNPDKLRVWDQEIHPALLEDFDDRFFGRIGYIDAATKIRLNIEAKAQEDIPVVKMEIKNDKGKVVKVITRPVTLAKPLSSWCLENYVDEYLRMKQEYILEDAGQFAKEKSIKRLKVYMRNAGFAVGRSATVYRKLDDFISVVPNLMEEVKSGVTHFFDEQKVLIDKAHKKMRMRHKNESWLRRFIRKIQ